MSSHAPRARLTLSASLLVLMAVGVVGVPAAGAREPDTAEGPPCFGEPATIVGTRGYEEIIGTDGPDVIAGLGAGDEISGLGGDDLICVGRPVFQGAVVHAGAGSDRVIGQGVLMGGPGDDVLISFATLRDAERIVRGGTGDDLLQTRGALNHGNYGYFVPGPGHDVIIGSPSELDIVVYHGSSRGVTVRLPSGTATGQGRDQLSHIRGISGSAHADLLVGNSASNTLFGGNGPDVLLLRGGSDHGTGGPGDDRVVGGAGDDRFLSGRVGRDDVFGGAGDDRLVEGPRREPNLIIGGSGTDVCEGGYTAPPSVERGCEVHPAARAGSGVAW
jgi:Ca2+-binding RTX toxin-like protein